MRRYLINLLTLFDTAMTVIVLAGSPYETISSRIQKRVEHGDTWAIRAAAILGWISGNPNHCLDARIPDSIITNAPNWWRA